MKKCKLQRMDNTWKYHDVRVKSGWILPDYEADESLDLVIVTGTSVGILNTICRQGYRWVEVD